MLCIATFGCFLRATTTELTSTSQHTEERQVIIRALMPEGNNMYIYFACDEFDSIVKFDFDHVTALKMVKIRRTIADN